MRFRMIFIPLAASAFAMVVAISCSSYGTSSPAPNNIPANTVVMASTMFNPATLTVTKGTTVTWQNKDGFKHTSTSDSAGVWDTGDIQGGASTTTTFNTVGTFPYHCIYHVSMGMRGTIIVK